MPETWRSAVDREIAGLGWADSTRIDEIDSEITIVSVDALPRAPLIFRPEGPATFSISIILGGRGSFSVEGAVPLAIAPGMAVLFTSGRFARGENAVEAGHRVRIVDLRFEPSLLMRAGGAPLARLGGDLLSQHSVPGEDIFLTGFPASASLLEAGRAIAKCEIGDGLARRLYLQGKALEILALVITSVEGAERIAPAIRRNERERLARARVLVERHFDRPWTIAQLAREVGLNERKLKAGFRLLVGRSVHAYLRDVRLDAAAALLRDGRSVTDSALAAGFGNLSHFSKVFREAKGLAPRAYAQRTLVGGAQACGMPVDGARNPVAGRG